VTIYFRWSNYFPLPGWLFKGNKEFYYPRAFFVLEMIKMERASPSIPNKENGLGVKPPA
jgi:hypothetical protein